ncbi:helix-turn-helix transcriptional regulator [Clostridium sp. BL-8]|uniref:helix-turn-helix transcriptional regulator n=1 Tax=Clostridium sp. BL-8 TaxID=349938 RepID=UPI00098CB721|nr:helix-turn-helix transcriptional regulator [Clostridium sp. BL-8]OOM69513.1 helix-turn-helix domain protein [Clostridium sp. BL-8]
MNNNIKQIIRSSGFKTNFIINKVGLSPSSFYEIMNGKTIPSLKNARKIAFALGVSLIEVFPEE